jgi:hypothetical protein
MILRRRFSPSPISDAKISGAWTLKTWVTTRIENDQSPSIYR